MEIAMRSFFLSAIIFLFFLSGFVFCQDTLYSETFANGALENVWYPGYNGNTMGVDFMTGNPSGDTWVGSLGNDLSGGGVGQSYSGNSTFADFYFEAQVFIPVNEGSYHGLEFRIDSSGNTTGYQFVAKKSTQSLLFRTRDGNVPVPVVREWVSAEIPGGYPTTDSWHHMAVQADGNQFWLYFNGQELPGCPYTDNTFASGWIGGYIWDMFVSPIYLNIDDIYVRNPLTAINDIQPKVITDFKLHQNFPNPFNPVTNIKYELAKSEVVKLTVYNLSGQVIRTLVNGTVGAGSHTTNWNATDQTGNRVSAGVYLYTLQAIGFTETRKMILLK